MKRSPQIMPKQIFMMTRSLMTSQTGLKVFLYIHVWESLAPGASCEGNVSSININIMIVFLGYTCQKTISMNNTFRECRSMANITGLLDYLVTYTAITVSILGLSRWNTNWNVRNSYSYAATANKIRFHSQFPRSPDAEFGGLIGWLFNWKRKFSCRMISKIANYLKYNYFWDGRGIENVTSWLWKFLYFCSRLTLGVAGDDIMFRILVYYFNLVAFHIYRKLGKV